MLTKILFFIACTLISYFASYIFSNGKNSIKIWSIIRLLIIQILIAYVLLNSTFGIKVVLLFSQLFKSLITFAHEGVEFVFGSLASNNKVGFVFFFNVGMSIILVSALIGILKYFRVLQFFFRVFGYLLSLISGRNRIESLNVVSSFVLGQSENYIMYKGMLHKMSDTTLYSICASAISTVSLVIVASYMTIIDPKYVIVAVILNMINICIVLHIINPCQDEEACDANNLIDRITVKDSFFEMLADHMWTGFMIAAKIITMMIGFIALIAMLNSIFSHMLGITFQGLIGYVFIPFSWLLHIPYDQMHLASEIMSTKIITNEFVAMKMLTENSALLSQHTMAVISTFLVSFANLSSLGVMIGIIQAIDRKAVSRVSNIMFKIFYGAFFVSILSASTVGLFI